MQHNRKMIRNCEVVSYSGAMQQRLSWESLCAHKDFYEIFVVLQGIGIRIIWDTTRVKRSDAWGIGIRHSISGALLWGIGIRIIWDTTRVKRSDAWGIIMRVNFLVEGMGIAKGGGIFSSAAKLAGCLRKKGVDVEINGSGYDYDIIHSHTPLLFSLLKLRKSKRRGIKVITHAHTTAEDAKGSWTLTEYDSVLNAAGRYLTFFYNHADLVLTPSGWTKETLRRRNVTRPIRVISNGVDTRIFRYSNAGRRRFRHEYGIGSRDTVVYCAGFVYIRKGIETFAEVARRFPDARFLWIGKRYPSLFVGFSKIPRVLDRIPDNMQLLGYVDGIVDAHCGSDVLLFPSYVENQGITVLEAMACKRPAVVRDLPSYKSWGFAHEKDCMMASSPDEFAESLSGVLEDKRLRKRLERSGLKHKYPGAFSTVF